MIRSVRLALRPAIANGRQGLPLLVVAVLFSVPTVAEANVGTPLMWVSGLHMVFGNACIGILEGVILAGAFKVAASRTIPLMVLANYFSAWFGWAWLLPQFEQRIAFDLGNTWGWLWKMTAIAYALTLILEWPFVAAGLFRTPRWLIRSLSAALLTQTVSYALIFASYHWASGASLYTQMSIVPIEEISLPENVLVYFIGERDGDAYCCDLGTAQTKRVRSLGSTADEDCLQFSWTDSRRWNLTSWREPAGEEKENVLVPDLDDSLVPHWPPDQEERRGGGSSAMKFGDVPRLGELTASAWRFRAGNWPIEGLRGTNPETGATIRFCLETPFASWTVRNATQLPSGQVVFQLGRRQICVTDPDTKRIAILTFGRGPVAILKPAANEGPSRLSGIE